MRERLGLTFTVLADPDLLLIRALGLAHEDALTADGSSVTARPAVLVFAPGGKIHDRLLTDNWRKRLDPQVLLERLRLVPR